mmetsp:Transcript_2555/g.4108  ORF Transcript_2555/g.4108 Transcript_2555/m.4108 type:complete len:80 (-) Transcript_2555:389-628(-)
MTIVQTSLEPSIQMSRSFESLGVVDEENEEDEARNQYIKDSFGDGIRVTRWKDATQNAVRVEVNAADTHMLESTRVASS